MGGKSKNDCSRLQKSEDSYYPFGMRIRESLAKGALIALAVVLIPVTAVSAQKITPGSTCKALNQKVVYQNKTFTCIKSGKKLVWNKGVAVVSTNPVEPVKPVAQNPIIDPTKPKEGQSCPKNSQDVVGYDWQQKLVVLMCNQVNDKYFPRPEGPKVDQTTGKVELGRLGSMNQTTEYRAQKASYAKPTSSISPNSELAQISQCRILDAGPYGDIPNNPQRHFTSGFPLYKERAVLTQNPTIQVVAVDFPDLQGKNQDIDEKRFLRLNSAIL